MSISQENDVSAGPVPPATPTQLFVDGAWRELGFAGIEGNTEEKTVTITF
jgi:hypothetical protein